MKSRDALLAIHPSIPAKTVKEMLALARSRPGHLTIAASGNGTPSHLAAELLKQSAKIDLLVVHYKGTGASLSDVVGGPGRDVVRHAGRPPAVREEREAARARRGLFAPAGTPRDTVARLHAEIVKALASLDVKQRLTAQGFDSVGNTPEQFVQVIRRDLARWQKVVAAAKLRGE